jgi:hypothetical protein
MAISRGSRLVQGLTQLFRGAFTLERLEELPEEPPAAAGTEGRSIGAMLFELEPLPEAPPEEKRTAPTRSFLSRLFFVEDLPFDPEPPKLAGPARRGVFRTILGIEELPLDPELPPQPTKLPIFRWLFWPESLDNTPPSSREK